MRNLPLKVQTVSDCRVAQKMRKLIIVTIFHISPYLSILGLYFSIFPITEPRPVWHWVVIAFGIAVSLYLCGSEILEHRRNAARIYKSQPKINRYMQDWLSSGGRAVIFSRDMSWAEDSITYELLKRKAEAGELTVCVERSMPLIERLEKAGAKVTIYGQLDFVPRSRFTIIDFEKEGARVAVGAKINGHHTIQEYQNGEHPFFGVAEDLIKILIAISKKLNK
jgi:hypothetical protein